MKGARPNTATTGGRRTIRVSILSNLLLFIALFGPQSEGKKYQALLAAISIDSVVLAVQLWVVGTTLFATGLFIWDLIRKSKGTAVPEHATKALVLDGVFLFAWWITLLVTCAYFYMLGIAA